MMDGNGTSYDAAHELSSVVGKAEDLLQALNGEAGQAVDTLRTRVKATIRAARERLTELNGTAREAAKVADKYVTSNPWTAVAVAVTAGAMAGALLARRS